MNFVRVASVPLSIDESPGRTTFTVSNMKIKCEKVGNCVKFISTQISSMYM